MIELALSVALCVAQPGGVLPDGTYRYQVLDSDKAVGRTTIVVSRASGAIRIDERVTINGDPLEIVRTLDPATYSTLSYAMTAQGSTYHIDVDAGGATFREKSNKKLAAPAAGPSVVFDFNSALYFAIPAMLHATGAQSFNVYCDCFYGPEAKVSTLETSAATPRPAGVPASDATLSFAFDDGVVTLWYDPASFVVHEVDIPKARFRYVIITPPY